MKKILSLIIYVIGLTLVFLVSDITPASYEYIALVIGCVIMRMSGTIE